jgi:Spy/CpxP family protein refolding chaperone
MKRLRTLFAIALFLVPFIAWAQTNPNAAAPDAGEMPPGPASAQLQAPTPPPPAGMPMLRMHRGGPPGAPFGPPAGPGLGAWWKNSDIVSKLQLSEEQVKKIEQTFLDHRLKLIDLQADLEKQELRLHPLLDVDQPDEAKVSAQIDLITAARGRLEKENAMMMLAIRRELTVAQWKKLQAMREERRPRAEGIHFRTGGPVPPPPGDVPKGPPEPPQP